MSDAIAIQLGKLIGALAVDSINTQVRFNEAHEIALTEFATMLDGVTDPTLRALLMATMPTRMHLETFEVEVGVLLTKETEIGFSLRALPLGVGFSILHAVRTERSSRVAVTVQQIPLEQPV